MRVGAEIGVLLLLFMLGLEYSGEELKHNLRTGFFTGVSDFVLNFAPGVIAGLVFGWRILPSLLLGGVTYISSSGIVAKLLHELGRKKNPETPIVLSVLVQEDLAMAIYLPVIGVLLHGGGAATMALSVSVAVLAVSVVLVVAVRYGSQLSRFVAHESDEIILLTVFGIVLVIAGIAQRFQVSSAIGAFLVGIALSGTVAQQSHRVIAPLRDLFAAIFFFFFGLEINPAMLVPALPAAVALGAVTSLTKVLTGYWAGRRGALDHKASWRAGVELIARGEFSIVIAGLGVAIEPRLGSVSACYVLLMAIIGPILARIVR